MPDHRPEVYAVIVIGAGLAIWGVVEWIARLF